MNPPNHSSGPPAATATPTVDALSHAQLVVGPRHLASAHAEDAGEAYPSVLSTPSLIALLERTCGAALQPRLAADESSVGVRVNVTHAAPTAVGQTVHASAKYLRQDGRLFVFEVTATDAAGTVATGEHARAIVKTDSIERSARERAARAGAAS